MSIFDTPEGERVNHKRTICEVHREIYDDLEYMLKDSDPTLFHMLIPKLEEAFLMAKKMAKRMKETHTSLKGIFPENSEAQIANALTVRTQRKELRNNGRPRILWLVDCKGWGWDIRFRTMQKAMPEYEMLEFNYIGMTFEQLNERILKINADLVMCLPIALLPQLACKENVIATLTSYRLLEER